MRQILFGVLSTLVCLIFGLHAVYGQGGEVDMSKCITLTVKQGEKIKLDFAASTSGVKVKVVGVKDEKEEEAPTSLHYRENQPKYEATSTEITVYGAINKFTCYKNGENLTALDVSRNVNLTELYCYNNQLSSLDVRQNVNLTDLYCEHNKLSSLDVSQNDKLTYLNCEHNQLSSLDVSNNGNLAEFNCSSNQLSSLDVSKNANLTNLDCKGNQLSSLDMSRNVNLTNLDCKGNQLSSLDVSRNVNLTNLDCSGNQLSSLDVSQNVNLIELYCYNNQLSSLDVRQNVNLTDLRCGSNQLPSLDVRQNVNLTNLGCSDNQLSSLDVSQNVNLTGLWCYNNQLSSLDVSQNVNLTVLNCSDTQLSSLDVSKNTQLEGIGVYGNNFSTSTLNSLYCQLPNRTGNEKGFICPVYEKGNVVDELLAKSASKQIADARNWAIQYLQSWTDIEDITGNHPCGSAYALELEPAAISNSFTYQGGEWQTTVKSTSNWKIDETTPLPDWIKVEPKEGNTGAQVTITVLANKDNKIRRAAVTFVLANDANTKQVMLLTQEKRPDQYIFVEPLKTISSPLQVERRKPDAVEEALFADVTVSPNPFHDQLRIANGNLEGEYILLNAQGVKVASGLLDVSETIVNTSKLSAGIYLLQLNAVGGATKTYRVVK